jgi:ABC-type sugar transport system ATPase subunit
MAAVDLENLTVRFGDVTAVDGFTMTLQQGEFVVLLGPSGCGKTTTLRCVAGLQYCTSGEIRFDGRPVTKLTPAERNVGMVFQFVSLYPHLTVRHNIAFPLRARGTPRAEIARKVDAVAKTFAISDILDHYVGGLPPGARQKVALARAVVREPDVLLLDEPLSGVEEQYREEMRWELRQFQKELGITSVYVTHDQREAMSLADRVVLMRDGRIIQSGPPAALFDNPADRFAASFIGSPSMNFLTVTVAADGLHVAAEQTLRVAAPPEVIAACRAQGLHEVVLGIRPHLVELANGAAAGQNVWPARLLDAVLVGRDLQADFAVGGQTIKAELPHDADVQDSGALRLPPEHCFFFGPSGSRVE